MEFLADYGLFLLKIATVVIAIVLIIGAAASAGRKASGQEILEVENLNKKYQTFAAGLKQAVLSKSEWKAEAKTQKERDKAEEKNKNGRPRAFLIDFKGDLKFSTKDEMN